MNTTLASFTDVLNDEICSSQPLSLSSSIESRSSLLVNSIADVRLNERPPKGTGQRGQFRSTEEIEPKYRDVFSYPYFNLVQSSVIEDALYSDKSIVVCAPTGSGKTVVFEMAIVQLLMEIEDKQYSEDFKIIYMAPVKALCTERLTEWYSKFTKLGLLCIEVTGDTDVDFTQLKPYKIIITTPEKWDMLTRRWRDHRGLVEVIKLFLIDEVHILNDETRGPVLEAVVSRMKTIEDSAKSVHRIENLQKTIQGQSVSKKSAPRIRFVAVSATVSNPDDVAKWLGTSDKPAVFYKFGDECRPVKLRRIVEGYPCSEGTSIFKFDIILNYKLWPVIQKYHSGKPTLIFCNTRKSVILTAETLSRELTISFNAEQMAKLTALASSIKNKKLQALVMSGVGCHHAGLLYEERQNIELAFRNRDLPILITTTTLAMGVNLPAHLVIVKNTQQYVNGAYQEYSISTVLQMVGRAGRPQFDTEATAVIMTRLVDKPRYQSLVGGCEPLQSYLHKRLPENLNSEAALGTVGDVAQCVQWLRSTFLYVRAARDPKKYLGLPQNSPQHLISKKIEELCVKAMNGLASSGLITMDEASCIESTEAGRLMSIFYLDLETMKQIMKIEGTESLERLLVLICESHELADMHLRVDERRCLNTLNRNNAAATIRFPMKGKISTRQMKLNCIIQAVLGCLTIPDPSLNQEAMKIMRIADRVCKCLVTYVTRPDLISQQPQFYAAVLNSILLAKCVAAHLWENSPFVSKQLKGIGPTFSTLLSTAGKVNFMLLEESHPRDLERIMNKGAPAGNVLRKQVSLLPKYQLTMTPVDEKTVTIQLALLNQSLLSENMENLTAGDNHKCYIIVGDSNNNLLLLAVFKDRDLISVFDGTIKYEVRRKHNFEHKLFAHCISSSFVGIDVQSEYMFNDLEQFMGNACTKSQKSNLPTKKNTERQTCITDTFKERKRKNTDAIEQSKEKKKRENALIENFKYLKKSFEAASNNVSQSLHQKGKQDNDVLNKKADVSSMTSLSIVPPILNTNSINEWQSNSLAEPKTHDEHMDSDEFIDEEKIDSILNEIENEMCQNKACSDNKKTSSNNNNLYFREKRIDTQNPFFSKLKAEDTLKNMLNINSTTKSSSYKTVSASRKRKPTTLKSNYNFIDLLEKNLSLSDEEVKTEVPQKDNGFSDTIKSQIQKYLTKTQTKTIVPDKNLATLLVNPKDELLNDDFHSYKIDPISLDCKKTVNTKHDLYPRYEIKEILGGNDEVEHDSIKQHITNNENLITNSDSKDSDMMTAETEKHYKYNKIDSSHDTNMKAPLTTFCNSDTLILDDKESKTTSSKCDEDKENNLNEPTFLNHSIGHKICTNEEYAKSEGNYCVEISKNHLDNLIPIKHHNLRKDSNKCLENVENLQSDVISSREPTNKFVSTQSTDINKLRTDMNQNMIRNDNPNFVLLNKNEFDDSRDSTRKNAIAEKPCLDVVPKTSARAIQDGIFKTSHDNIWTTDDISCNMRYDKAHCNTRLCYPSVSYSVPTSSDIPNKSQNLLRNSSNKIEVNKQNTEYVKRYTYSSSKIDVCTKQTPEFCVQLIKKVKMDLDITAIVSRKPSSFQNYNSGYEGTSESNEELIEVIKKPKRQNSFQYYRRDANKVTTTANNVTRNTAIVNFPLTRLSGSECTTKNVIQVPYKAIIEEENENNNLNPQIINKSDRCDASDLLINKNESNIFNEEVPIPEIEHKELQHDNYNNNSEKLRQTESENSPVAVENKIKNILQKYSKILATNTTKSVESSCSGTNRAVTCNRPTNTIKSRKPFKIADIHKLHTTLPNNIIEHKNDVAKNILLPNNCDEMQNKFENFNSSPHAQCTEITAIEEIPEYESITDLDLEQIHLPVNVDLEPSNDYKIDQTMFDPQTLLQCVVDEDFDDIRYDIVPPPPEFCDGITYSPDYENVESSIADYRSRTPQLDINDMEYNESIFDDTCATDLTPSREIETWNLSREDSWGTPDAINLNPANSFTVMRRNISNDSNFLQNTVMPRQEKLRKFKFSQKNKFKIKK